MSLPISVYVHAASPVGPLLLAGNGEVLQLIGFPRGSRAKSPMPHWRQAREPFADVICQLDEYFAGARTAFSLPVAFEGTVFQEAVWSALRDIPFGETVSYGDLAVRLTGGLTASRAIGAANGANPLPIILPCHRVIGADGSLTGFGGGLATKRFLLAHEQRIRPRPGAQLSLFG